MRKTRILSLLIALVMVLGMLPSSAFAADNSEQAAPTVQITHINLRPCQDALGFKAKVDGLLEAVTEIGFCFRVNSGAKMLFTKATIPQDGIFSARVQNVLANNGGDTVLEAYAFVRMGDVTITSETRTATMKNTLQILNDSWYTAGYNRVQKNAVKALCEQYRDLARRGRWTIFSIIRFCSIAPAIPQRR